MLICDLLGPQRQPRLHRRVLCLALPQHPAKALSSFRPALLYAVQTDVAEDPDEQGEPFRER